MTLIVRLSLALALLLAFTAPRASADVVLFEWALNLNGVIYTPAGPALPASVDASGFDFITGLGKISIAAGGVGGYGLFVDHELSEAINTFFNEVGLVAGVAPAGVSWEIDEPGYVFGDIYTNFGAGTPDNTNSVPVGLVDDVSMALFQTAAAGDTVNFYVSTAAPLGFYLAHRDPDSDETIYFSTTPGHVPEPSLPLLLALGAGIAVAMRRFRIA